MINENQNAGSLNENNPKFDYGIFTVNDIIEEASGLLAKNNSTDTGFFNCRSANDCIKDAKLQPIPRKLYKDLLIENELTILVADTGVGKSIFAVQIANEISKTEKVLYLDLELSDKQFHGRYSNDYTNEYVFNENFYRVVFKRRYEIPVGSSYDDYFIESLKELIESSIAKIIIIDNMTCLISSDTDQAKSAKPLMDTLNNLRSDYNLTMLLLEHTKKVDPSRPIHHNDLQGSKMKSNFADAIFTIGRSSKDKNLRYIKQLKVRSGEMEFDSENIMVYEICKEDSLLYFRFVEYSNEISHLKQQSEDDKAILIENVKELSLQGKTQRQIAKELSIAVGTVNKYLKK